MNNQKCQSSDCGTCSSHSKPIDKMTGVEVDETFEPFSQQNDIFCRSMWDPEIINEKAQKFFAGYYMPFAKARNSDGFQLKEYAFRNAAWHVSNIIRDIEKSGEFRKEKPDEIRKEGFWDYYTSHDEGWNEAYKYESKAEAKSDLKKVAKACGIGEIGICEYDERWMYSAVFDHLNPGSKPTEIPEDLPTIIVTMKPMDQELIKTVPSALSGVASGLGYTFDAVAVITLAQYIRNMGYRAYATLNDSALAIPLALQAGLGEVGRNGLIINDKYGPRHRIGKIFTDMPLEIDLPKNFGVEAFCKQCDRCAAACPPKAIPFGAPSNKIHSISNIQGVVKWTPSAEKCFKFWANQSTECSICIRSCPYNRDYTKWYHRAWFVLAKSPLRRFALWLDYKYMVRGRLKSSEWWRTI